MTYEIRPVGHVESPLIDRANAPMQGIEGAPEAWLVFDPAVAEGIGDLAVGDDVFVRVRVTDLEAIDGTPVADVKPVLGAVR